MSKRKDAENFSEMGERIEGMMGELKARGFTREESVQMVAAMLASAQVYMPFIGMTELEAAGGLH